MELVTRGAFSGPRMNLERPARASGLLPSGCVVGMRAEDSVSGAGVCGFGNTRRCLVAWDGARNHRSHDDAKSLSLKSILMRFQFLLCHIDNCPERDLNNLRAYVRNCAT